MLSFAQFIDEAHHKVLGRMYRDWGIVHPTTGEVISGESHPTAKTHSQLKKSLDKRSKYMGDAPEWAHVDYGRGEGHLMLRSVYNHNKEAAQKAYRDLPHHSSGNVVVNNKQGNFLQMQNHLRTHDFNQDYPSIN